MNYRFLGAWLGLSIASAAAADPLAPYNDLIEMIPMTETVDGGVYILVYSRLVQFGVNEEYQTGEWHCQVTFELDTLGGADQYDLDFPSSLQIVVFPPDSEQPFDLVSFEHYWTVERGCPSHEGLQATLTPSS